MLRSVLHTALGDHLNNRLEKYKHRMQQLHPTGKSIYQTYLRLGKAGYKYIFSFYFGAFQVFISIKTIDSTLKFIKS